MVRAPALGRVILPCVEREVVLTTPRLVVTTWVPSDVDDLLEVHSDPETMRYVRAGRPETRAEVEELVDSYIAEHNTRGWTKWRLADHQGALIGRAGFGSHDENRELAYTIRRSHWGRGLATEIAGALVTWHFAHAPDEVLGATVVVGHDRSVRVLTKVGFIEWGTTDYKGLACLLFRYSPSPRGESGVAPPQP
jgi:ribosomal-protein-alanine N-acetyltransferase